MIFETTRDICYNFVIRQHCYYYYYYHIFMIVGLLKHPPFIGYAYAG